jgi:ppGpp synthetase/RelA/SpoT-type nucleotidyltranferase
MRARDAVEWWRSRHIEPMLVVQEQTSRFAPPMDLGALVAPAVSFRPKRFQSTIEKLTREPGKLADMVDIGGVRAVVDTQDEVGELHAELGTVLDIRRVRDWARQPRSSGYRAVHLHVRQDGFMIEVQLRTFGQDAWANVVEEETRLSGVNYKSGEGSAEVLDFFRNIAQLFAAVELGESHPNLADRVYASYRRAKPHLHMPILRNIDL